MTASVLLLIAVAALVAVTLYATREIAEDRGRQPGVWMLLALVGPVWTPLLLRLMPRGEYGMDMCSFCFEMMRNNALACPHCGRDVPEDGREAAA